MVCTFEDQKLLKQLYQFYHSASLYLVYWGEMDKINVHAISPVLQHIPWPQLMLSINDITSSLLKPGEKRGTPYCCGLK